MTVNATLARLGADHTAYVRRDDLTLAGARAGRRETPDQVRGLMEDGRARRP